MSIENIRSVLKSIETNFTDIPNDQVDDVAVLSTHSIMSISIANESPTTSVNITDDQISNIIVGASAKHKIFGLGTVKSIDCAKNHIVVSFPIGEKAFLLSDCIKKGYLVFS